MKSIDNLNDEVIKSYKNGESILSISNRYGCSRQTITRYIKKYNEFIEREKPIQKTNIDLSQTKNITPEMSYFLGLLWTDGYMSSNNGYTIGIKLVGEDMQEIRQTINKIGKYSYYEGNPIGRKPTQTVAFYSKEFYTFLRSLDYETKSTSSADKVLSIIPEDLKKYFFRGIVDGDGHISFRDAVSYGLSIVSTYNQDWSYIQKSYDNLGIKYSIVRIDNTDKNSKSSSINVYNIKDILKFLDYIYHGYENDKIGLIRKYNKYKLILSKR